MSEVWKLSIDHTLEVSSLGNVRTIERAVRCGPKPGMVTRPATILTPHILTTGYAQVQGGSRKKHAVHRLVAHAFVQGFSVGLVVNHKNGDRVDNRVENLEWCTTSQNLRHSYRELGRVGWCKGVVSVDHPTSKAIIAKNLATGKEQYFGCALDAIRAGVAKDSGSVSRCCTGQYRWHNGHAFRFADDRESSHAA